MTSADTAYIDEAIDEWDTWSGYSADAARWTPEGTPQRELETPTPEQLETIRQAFTQASQLITEVGKAAGLAMEHVGKSLQEFARAVEAHKPKLEAAGLVPEQPPSDPMQAAIWRKQRRDTGPKPELNAYKDKRKPRR